jgi:GTPase
VNNMERESLSVQTERALVVAVLLPNSKNDPADPLAELRNLAATAGAEVVDQMIAKRRKVFPRLYVGTGKADEIAARAEANDADVVIFDNDLSPAQIRDLEEIIGRKILDRSELILDIFAAHARTAESRLQVELAQLEYTYPRLRNMWSHLERIAGGAASAAGGIGTRGPGEKQIEIDRRLVQKRVSVLKREIEAIDKRKVRQVSERDRIPSVCLVGYTNAGKSTAMHLLTGADVYIADQLFATLDTRTRKWDLGEGNEVLLSDTVGFVRDLPHNLVASFRATLEEAIWANLLIHVADASNERVLHQIESVDEVLEDLGCKGERLLVLNKVDQIIDPTVRTVLAKRYPDAVFLSALTGEGAAALIETVTLRLMGHASHVVVEVNCANGKAMSFIHKHMTIDSETYEDTTARIEGTLPATQLPMLDRFGDDIKLIEE